MSAAVVWGLVTAPARMPSPTARPRLRLVGPDERAKPDGCGGCGGCGYVSLHPAVRIGRHGRLVITLMMTAVLALAALVLATSVNAAAPQIDHATTVSAGQTLSEVAAAQLPGLPINDAVARIQLANGLNTLQVHAGQSLRIPEMP